jgi:hypothetical protein
MCPAPLPRLSCQPRELRPAEPTPNTLQPGEGLPVRHENLAGQDAYHAVSAGWPAVLANLKSLLETGHVLPQPPWEMHADLRAAQMAPDNPR